MNARPVTGALPPDKLDEALELWKRSVLPTLKQQKGFKGVRMLIDRKNGKIATMGLWDTAGDVSGSKPWNQDQIAKFTGLFSEPPVVGHYEVVFES